MMQREDFMKILSCNIRFRQEDIGHIHVEFGGAAMKSLVHLAQNRSVRS